MSSLSSLNTTIAALACSALCFTTACRSAAPDAIDVATTTSVQNSGLLDHLPLFERTAGVTVRIHATGSGRALQMLADGDVDAVIAHSPENEQRLLPQHPDWSYRKIAHNWFVVAGPADDPARIGSAGGAVAAFQRIVDAQARFVSRGDESGTHERERTLWKAAGRQPSEDRLIVSGRGMAQALRHADEARAYVLTDAPTFWQLAGSLEQRILFERDPLLLNTYAVIHPRGNDRAAGLAAWLVSAEGKSALASFLIDGKRAYEPWPDGCAGDRPDAEPCLPRTP
jgi:tungstate transport system substrate-binding protein